MTFIRGTLKRRSLGKQCLLRTARARARAASPWGIDNTVKAAELIRESHYSKQLPARAPARTKDFCNGVCEKKKKGRPRDYKVNHGSRLLYRGFTRLDSGKYRGSTRARRGSRVALSLSRADFFHCAINDYRAVVKKIGEK